MHTLTTRVCLRMFYLFVFALCFALRVLYVCLNSNHVHDFEPRRVKDFMVTSATGKERVELFYAWLDAHGTNQSSSVAPPVQNVVQVQNRLISAGYNRMLKALYHQEHMWMQLESVNSSSVLVQQWRELVHALFITQVGSELSTPVVPDNVKQYCAHLTHLFHNLIQYSNVYKHPRFPLAQHDAAFLRTVLRLALSSSANVGFLPGFLLFAHLCPNFVRDDCYPYLNNETHVYQHVVDIWDVEEFSPLYANLILQYESFVNL